MLDDMLTQIEELMGRHHSRHASVLHHNLEWPSNALLHAESSKTSSKRKSSSSGTTAPKAKKPKQQRLALNEAATAMHAELRAMGFSSPADFGKVKWEDFKTDLPAVIFRLLCLYLQSSCQGLTTAGQIKFACH